MPMLDGPAVLNEAADPLVRYSPVINCLQVKNGFRIMFRLLYTASERASCEKSRFLCRLLFF